MAIRYNPSVDHTSHKTLQQEIMEWLEKNNFTYLDDTYATIADGYTKSLLSKRFNPTALKIRSKADLCVSHKYSDLTFFLEIKTYTKYSNLALELFPLLSHIVNAQLGIKCLYCFRTVNHIGGFWADQLPKISEIKITNRIEYRQINPRIELVARNYLPETQINHINYKNGSGDPYCIIKENEAKKCRHWKYMILPKQEPKVVHIPREYAFTEDQGILF